MHMESRPSRTLTKPITTKERNISRYMSYVLDSYKLKYFIDMFFQMESTCPHLGADSQSSYERLKDSLC